MKNVSIKWSITAALLCMAGMIGALSALNAWSGLRSEHTLQELAGTNAELNRLAGRVQFNVLETRLYLDRYASFSTQGNPEAARQYLQRAIDALGRADSRMDELSGVVLGAEDTRAPLLAAIEQAYADYVSEGLAPLVEAAPFQVQRRQPALDELAPALSNAAAGLVDYTESRSREAIVAAQSFNQHMKIVVSALLAVALLTALLIRWLLIRDVVKPLREAVGCFEHIARGNLNLSISDRGRNEIGQLFTALDTMQGQLRELVAALRDSSQSVFAGAGNTSGASHDLARRTGSQRDALIQISGRMAQLTERVGRNSEAAREADSLSADASRAAQHGGSEVEQTLASMRDIAGCADQIREIVTIMDSIAFQTNLLALNASVEAARAGEQGRGFAVVAGEVRALAGRSADSARQIRQLIENTTERVGRGVEQAERSGDIMAETVDSIRRLSSLAEEIAAAAREQSHDIEQINAGLDEVSAITHDNSALVEQTSTAADDLEGQAQRLADLMARFRIDREAADRERPGADSDALQQLHLKPAVQDTALA
ncbi:methyl-accepting chemotaxis protein [Kushneria aurantia]|uniref:Methyl-accepting chemotaxis protein n=1 Tax=Kushneria aurantia TaxID=504092 RepID=A0ABV6G014_9GAMM|nr:methyl-accepting chemotaxis protein [Kushneria aurantia]